LLSHYNAELSKYIVEVFDRFAEVFNLFAEVFNLFVEVFNLFVEVFNLFVEVFNLFVEVFYLFVEVFYLFVEVFNLLIEVFYLLIEVFYLLIGLQKDGVLVKKPLNSVKNPKKGLNLPLLLLYFPFGGFFVLLAVAKGLVYDFVNAACHFRSDVFDDDSAVFLSAGDCSLVSFQFLFC